MCGIAGAVGAIARAPDAPTRVRAMVDAIGHRGPDANATVTLAGPRGTEAIFGAVRLRVIDLDPVADQPLANTAGDVWTVFNGEIYNHRELRDLLRAAGFRFSSATDTEVLVHLYRYLDGDVDAMARRLRGMFAFAVFDTTTGRAVAARDRLGIKPFVFTRNADGFAFCSEQRSLVRGGFVDGSPDLAAIAGYMAKGVATNGHGLVRGVEQLAPGHALSWHDGKLTESSWWEPRCTSRITLANTDVAEAELRDVAQDAVSRHLVADRNVGLFLSSGTDSQSVAAFAARGGVVQSLTVSFPERADMNEAVPARAAAARLGLEHSEIPVTGADAASALPAALAAFDSPTADGFNSWLISRAAKEAGMTVVLSGLGGDELFAGYPTFRAAPRLRAALRAINLMPGPVRTAVSSLAGSNARTRAWARALDGGAGISDAYHLTRRLFSDSDLAAIGLPSPCLPTVSDELHALDAVTLLELGSYLRDQLLPDSDTTSMSHSIELRVPLLDDQVVAFALALPPNVRRTGKQLLATAAGLGDRPPKRPFALPMQHWTETSLRTTVRDALLDDTLPFADVLPATFRQQLWLDAEAKRVHWSKPWSVAVLRLWPQANGFAW